MKKIIVFLFSFVLLFSVSFATPSTTYWTPSVSDIQPFGVWHIGVDNYFTVLTKTTDTPVSGAFPTDVGLTVGILPFQNLQMEVGIDLLEASNDPWFLNAKIGAPEGVIFAGFPSVGLGIFNVGLNQSTQGQNIWHLVLGKDLGAAGRIHVSPYYKGSFSGLGLGSDDSGWMIGYDKGFAPTKDSSGEYSKWVFAADYASGNNA
ncbi:MAG: hypothetical protein AABZ57_07035, partial [Candidatus Margulisiibacteriota bacterium]